MPQSPLNALSPLDGRYHKQAEPLRSCFSEAALYLHAFHLTTNVILFPTDHPEQACQVTEEDYQLPFCGCLPTQKPRGYVQTEQASIWTFICTEV